MVLQGGSNTQYGSAIDELSVIGRANFILAGGKVFAWGEGRLVSPGSMSHFPHLIPTLSIPSVLASPYTTMARRLVELETINGKTLQISHLMQSSSLSRVPWVPFAAIATVTGTIQSPQQSKREDKSVSMSHDVDDECNLVGWGDNSPPASATSSQLFQVSTSPIFGFENASPYISSPLSLFGSQMRNVSFPFDRTNSEYAFSSLNGFALTPEGEVWYWGRGSLAQETGASFPQKFDSSANGAMMLLRGASMISSYADGLVVVLNTGEIGCISTQGVATDCYYVEGGNPLTPNTDGLYIAVQRGLDLTTFSCSANLMCAGASMDRISIFFSTEAPGRLASNTTYTIPSVSNITKVIVTSTSSLSESLITVEYFDASEKLSVRTSLTSDPSHLQDLGLPSSGFVKMWASGLSHVLVVYSNGAIMGWGMNDLYQLSAVSTPTLQRTSVNVHPPYFPALGTIVDIGASGTGSFVLLANGDVYSWGVNGSPLRSLRVKSLSAAFVNIPKAFTQTTPIKSVSHSGIIRLLSVAGAPVKGQGAILVANTQTRFLAISNQTAINDSPYEDHEESPNHSVPAVCSGNPPISGAICILVDGKPTWVVPKDLNAPQIFVSGDITIIGNLSVGSIVLKAKGGNIPFINVTGCALLGEPLTISLTESDLKSLSKRPGYTTTQVVLEAGCLVLKGFDANGAVKVSSAKSCRKVSVKTSQKTTPSDPDNPSSGPQRISLLTTLQINSNNCKTWWIIVICVIGALLLIGIIVAIVFTYHIKFQRSVAPYHKS